MVSQLPAYTARDYLYDSLSTRDSKHQDEDEDKYKDESEHNLSITHMAFGDAFWRTIDILWRNDGAAQDLVERVNTGFILATAAYVLSRSKKYQEDPLVVKYNARSDDLLSVVIFLASMEFLAYFMRKFHEFRDAASEDWLSRVRFGTAMTTFVINVVVWLIFIILSWDGCGDARPAR